MKFSVLIPVYNTEEYLDECIQSVLNQTYQDFEMILVDDGSTDNSRMICDEYYSEYPDKIKVIHKENQGLISARRVGIAKATGDYCIFVDSDDYIKENLLSKVNSILDKDATIDLLIYSFNYVKNGKIVKKFQRIEQDGIEWNNNNRKAIIEKLLYSNDVTPLWIKAVKTSFLKSDSTDYSKFYKKNMAEDYLQSLYLITYAKKIVYYYLPLYCYNYNSSSISRDYSYSSINKQKKLHVYFVVMDYLKIWNMNEPYTIKHIDARWFDETMYLFYKCYDKAKTKSEKKRILQFNWSTMLPNCDLSSFSELSNNDYCIIYDLWKSQNTKKIDLFFKKRKLYAIYRKIKNQFLNL